MKLLDLPRHLTLAEGSPDLFDSFRRHLTVFPGHHALHYLLHRRRALWRRQLGLEVFVARFGVARGVGHSDVGLKVG
jgi:hypothetical protein